MRQLLARRAAARLVDTIVIAVPRDAKVFDLTR
jgi:hypothetical protein